MAFKMRSGHKPEFKEMGSSPKNMYAENSPNDMYAENSPSNMMEQGDPTSPNKILPLIGAGLMHGARMLGTYALRKGAQKLAKKGIKKAVKTQMSKTIAKPKNLLPVKYKPKKMGVVKHKPKTNFTRPKTGSAKSTIPKLTPEKTFGQKAKSLAKNLIWPKSKLGKAVVIGGTAYSLLGGKKSKTTPKDTTPKVTTPKSTTTKPSKSKVSTTPISTPKPKSTAVNKRSIGGAKKTSQITYGGGAVKQKTKIKGRAFGEGKKIKQKNYDEAGKLTSKTKEKYRRKGGGGEGMAQDYYKGRMKKKKTVTKTGGIVTKTKIKYNKDGTIKKQRTKTRKRRLA